ncbi:hypothetical protein ACX1C1_07785 [Paenibacillus sp. strain BS8-2]
MKRYTIRSIVACTAISFALATGTVYAATDAGSYLRQWYETRTQHAQTQLSDAIELATADAASPIAELSTELAVDADDALLLQAETIQSNNASVIQAYGSKYADKVVAAEQLATTAMQLEFDAYVERASRENADELEQTLIDTIEELTEQLDSE